MEHTQGKYPTGTILSGERFTPLLWRLNCQGCEGAKLGASLTRQILLDIIPGEIAERLRRLFEA
jgi:hypothetical protein